jgi:ribose transport system permease protein
MSWITTRRYAWPILVALAIFAGLNAAASPAFTDSGNWNGMLIGAAPFIITAMAQTAVVMSGDGGVDLSVGPLAGLVNALIASVLVPHGWTDPVSIVGGTLLVGVASGLLNGIMVAVVRVQPIIATLGTYLAYQGITLEMMPMAGGQAPDWLVAIANSRGGVPGVLVLLVALGIAWLAFERTAFRRNLLAVGGDARAAYASGVNVTAVRIIAYVIGGILAAVAGLVFTAALGSGDPRVGVPYTLSSIAAVALGGVALSGGRGGMLGSAAAGALLFLIQTLFTLAQVSIFYIQIMYGVILFLALTLNAAGERARRARMGEQTASIGAASREAAATPASLLAEKSSTDIVGEFLRVPDASAMFRLWVATKIALFDVPLAVHLAEFVVVDSSLEDFRHWVDAAGEADDE